MGQVQLWDISLINLVVLAYPMLYTKFKINGKLVLEKKIFKRFSVYGHYGRLADVAELICITFSHNLSYEISFQLTQQFLRKTVLIWKSE